MEGQVIEKVWLEVIGLRNWIPFHSAGQGAVVFCSAGMSDSGGKWLQKRKNYSTNQVKLDREIRWQSPVMVIDVDKDLSPDKRFIRIVCLEQRFRKREIGHVMIDLSRYTVADRVDRWFKLLSVAADAHHTEKKGELRIRIRFHADPPFEDEPLGSVTSSSSNAPLHNASMGSVSGISGSSSMTSAIPSASTSGPLAQVASSTFSRWKRPSSPPPSQPPASSIASLENASSQAQSMMSVDRSLNFDAPLTQTVSTVETFRHGEPYAWMLLDFLRGDIAEKNSRKGVVFMRIRQLSPPPANNDLTSFTILCGEHMAHFRCTRMDETFQFPVVYEPQSNFVKAFVFLHVLSETPIASATLSFDEEGLICDWFPLYKRGHPNFQKLSQKSLKNVQIATSIPSTGALAYLSKTRVLGDEFPYYPQLSTSGNVIKISSYFKDRHPLVVMTVVLFLLVLFT